ncbi:MAG: PHB depolymerase family esterase [Pseudomonadota bacterium]
MIRPLECAGAGCVFGLIFLASLIGTSKALADQSCGDGGRCTVGGGYYLAALPPDWDGVSKLPLVVFFHGWNASPEGTFRNKAMVNGVTRRGAMFVAPFAQTGYWRQIGAGRAEGGRDERAYIRAVMADVKKRWPVDDERTLASGFSRGASMAWNVACYEGDLFAAYAPIAGGFWHSNPDDCPGGPVNLRHIHGLNDRVVAYDEVGIYNSMPITEGMTILRTLNRCNREPDRTEEHNRLQCQTWTSCGSGRRLQICLHEGGHSIPAEWVAEGFDWLSAFER